ncbi:PhzF family phenazine biosynthesis protein [Eionea flava]
MVNREKSVDVAIVSAFIDGDTGGNPAGVVLNADTLNHEDKLSIAQQVGLSETAFVSESTIADFTLDFYTPTRQIAHCGHATVATFSYLSQKGLVGTGLGFTGRSSKQTIDGPRDILIQKDQAYMEQSAPRYENVEDDQAAILASLGLTPDQLITAPTLVNTGNSFILVSVDSEATLSEIQPNQDQISTISDKYDLIGFYVFTTEAKVDGRDAGARMFAPRYGINEEAATGMAAGPLACLLRDRLSMPKETFVIEQGNFMAVPSPSVIAVNLVIEGGAITSLMAGGEGRFVRQMTAALP